MTDSNFIIKKGLDVFDGDVSLKGSNKELRFYEGANYVGFEAPALTADKIWVLPNADGSTGQALKTDGSGNLGWVTAGDATLAGTQTFTGTKSFSSEINLNNTYGRLNFKGGNNHSIDFYNANGAALKGRITYMISSNQMRLQANSADQLYITDGAIYPPVDNDVDLGTSSLKFKDSFFGLVDAENFKVNGGQGSDGQVLTSTGSGVAWEDAAGGSALNDLSDATTYGSSNIGLGSGALDSLAESGGNHPLSNVALGINAGTAITTGDGHTAIGYNALKTATTQAESTAIGYLAGEDLAGGAFGSTSVGVRSLSNFTTGWGNTSIGHDAMWSQNGAGTGSQNTALGYQAMKGGVGSGVAITGSFNVGLGSHANSRLVDGTANVAVGHQANNNISSGSYNIGIGMRANQFITTGNRNIAIGHEALNGFDTESDNIAIGYDALGGDVAGGEKNIAIGNYAGDAVTSADNTVLVGYEAGSSITSSTDSIGIGYQAGKSMGNQTIAIGSSAASIGTGWRNVMIGYGAGKRTTDHDNVVIGWEAGDDGTAYGQSVFIGSLAGKRWGIGDKNVAIGYGSGGQQDAASGNDAQYNTVIGHGSGDNVTDGDYNVFLGQSSGDNITTGSNNVVIGAADVSSATGDSQLSISSGDGGVAWITGASTGVVDFPNGLTNNGVAIESAFETITDVTIGSGTSGTTSGIYLGANNEAGIVAGEVSSVSTANDGYIELMNMDLDVLTGASGLQTIELTIQIEDETNGEVESFKALVQATEKTVLGTTARAVNFTEWAILFDGAARIGTLAADYDSSDDTIRIRYQNKQGTTATLTATFYAITMQNNT